MFARFICTVAIVIKFGKLFFYAELISFPSMIYMTFTFMHLADAKASYTPFKVYISLVLSLPGNQNYDLGIAVSTVCVARQK